MMDRRAVIRIAGGSILAEPLAVRAQQTGKVWRIGVLSGSPPERWKPFHDSLRGLGYVEGQNIAFEWRLSGGRAERFPDLAADLVRLKVDLIVASDNPAIAAAQKSTKTIPIVMVGSMDPVTSGFAQSLARPGGNITGQTVQGTDLQGKLLQILKEAVPPISRVGILWVPTELGREVQAKEAERAARVLGVQPRLMEVRRRRARRGFRDDGAREGGRGPNSPEPADLCAPSPHRRIGGEEPATIDE